MRPTTSTTTSTNNSKNISRQISQIFWKLRSVSTPIFSRFNSTIWRIFCGSSFRFLTHSRYNFKRDCERRVKFGLRILVLEKTTLLSIEKEKIDWLLLFSTMATDGAAEFMSNYGRSVLIPIYEISRNYENRKEGGRRADLLIGNGNTNLRDASYEITKRPRYW